MHIPKIIINVAARIIITVSGVDNDDDDDDYTVTVVCERRKLSSPPCDRVVGRI